ncbi:MAG: serine/threonine-protein kinase [Pirellulaceae bacterium]|nr:serine/threonine-protein kinase [Pirellulaceae bacterium]MDP7014392.1 serine/threonine-protein kinase [Pirellulaceae bacterium]
MSVDLPKTEDWNGDDDLPLASLIKTITRRLQGGEPIDEERLFRDHPANADQLRRLLPILRMMAEATTEEMGARPPLEGTAVSPSKQSSLLVPKQLGDYEIIGELGRGAMGVVFEARQISLHKKVALKTLPMASVLDSRSRKRFENEARAAAQLQHPNIVSVHAFGVDRGVHYYAMQYIAGTDLAHIIRDLKESAQRPTASTARVPDSTTPGEQTSDHKRGSTDKLSSERLFGARSGRSTSSPEYLATFVRMGIEIADGLQHAHNLGVVHRDIKPSNLMVDQSGTVMITDFGLAQVQGNPGLTMTGDLIGTLRYMSPEQAYAKRLTVDHRSDIYALGVTLYELLTLRRAFDGDRAQLPCRRVLHGGAV